jgi:hypothetical protein
MPKDPRIDTYIAKAAPFAQPILKPVRAAVHAGCPEVVETIKWSVPSFEYKGPFCGMAAFKKHVMFGFWKHQLMTGLIPKGEHRAYGQYGRIESLDDAPSQAHIVKLVKLAKKLTETREGAEGARPKKPPVKTPAFLAAALKKNAKARATMTRSTQPQARISSGSRTPRRPTLAIDGSRRRLNGCRGEVRTGYQATQRWTTGTQKHLAASGTEVFGLA